MGNCYTLDNTTHTSISSSDLRNLSLLLLNASEYYDDDYNAWDYENYTDFSSPCYSYFCPFLSRAGPPFLATASALALLSNLAAGVALAMYPRVWGDPPRRALACQLTLSTAIFAALLPFFTVGISQGWVFGINFCQLAYMLWHSSLFAQGHLVASSTASTLWDKQGPWSSGVATALWLVALLLATPAAMLSNVLGDTHMSCVLRTNSLSPLYVAHVTICLAIFILLPVMLGLAKVALKWCWSSWAPRVSLAWVFFLLWTPYTMALLLDFLQNRQLLAPTCAFREGLNFFLGVSQGLGVLHCCLGPLLLLGAGLCQRV
ncbi:atypical chemokine receptor 1 [Alligator sinensis]|uniref:Atypical chemokine receptor 1 n=1 Tax=Alligator sinensis TaxID=38654 RepID=A0A1U7SFL3_ALLSI|nr:atypical chemokine receptor 1 [Alligator sinensis]